MQHHLLTLTTALFLAGSTTVSAQARGSFDRTLDVSGAVQLDVATGSGSITVKTGGDGTVTVHGEIRARSSRESSVRRIEANPPIVQNGNRIEIGRIEDDELRRHVSISYEIVVPADTQLDATTGSGKQTVGDIAGPVEVSSGSGSLDLGRIGSDVEARTGSGSIKVASVAGDLDVKTGSGSIRAEGVGGAISASSGSGSVELEQTGSGDVKIRSGSGRVRVNGVNGGLSIHTASGSITARGNIAGEWDLHASSGSISVDLPDSASFELDAESRSGSIDVSYPVTMSGRLTKRSLTGTVGSGGPRLGLRTSSGSIEIQ